MAKQQPTGQWENITPAKAEKWLNELNLNNRKLREGVAEKYANDMASGNWLKNPQPIMFFEDGSLADGQHRLWAICVSGTTQQMYVIRNVDRAAALNIDTGLARSYHDNEKIATGNIVSKASMGVTKMAAYGTQNIGFALSHAQRRELQEHFKEPAEWVESHLPNKRYLGNAVVGAALVRAHMHEKDLERLSQFCEVLNSGMPDGPQDSACIAIRNYLLEQGGQGRDARDMFLKVMNAIKYFMRRKALTVIKGVKDEVYPLPGGTWEPPKRSQKGRTPKIVRRSEESRVEARS